MLSFAVHTLNLPCFRYLKKKKSVVDAALEKTLPTDDRNVEKIVSSMNYSLLAGGKRIRPILCLTACEMFGGTDLMAMPTAVALEMVHTSSLIHDGPISLLITIAICVSWL
jgi:geranylgeranyl diphosphate synthase type II